MPMTPQTVVDDDGTGTTGTVWNAASQLAFEASIDAELAKLVKVLHRNITAAGNVSTTESTWMNYTLPGATLGVNEDAVRIHVWGTCAANTNTKTVKLYLGSRWSRRS